MSDFLIYFERKFLYVQIYCGFFFIDFTPLLL